MTQASGDYQYKENVYRLVYDRVYIDDFLREYVHTVSLYQEYENGNFIKDRIIEGEYIVYDQFDFIDEDTYENFLVLYNAYINISCDLHEIKESKETLKEFKDGMPYNSKSRMILHGYYNAMNSVHQFMCDNRKSLLEEI